MTILDTKLNARSAEFQANAAAMRAVVDDLKAQIEKATQGGGEAARAKHTARGKLLPRDRVQMLLDPGTPFLELSPLAALNMYDARRALRRCHRRHRPRQRCGLHDRLQRRHGEGRHLLPADREEAPARAGEWRSRTACPASTWWTRAAPTCRTRTRSSPTATTSAASSSTRPT
jgi:hypothetical protein